MIDKLTKFYKNNVIAYSLVFKEIKIRYHLFIVFALSLYLTTLQLVVKVGLYFYFAGTLLNTFNSFLISLVLCVGLFFHVNSKAKKIVRKKFRFRNKGFSWRTDEFEKMQSRILIDHLREKKLYKEEKLKQLIDLCYKEIERKKLPSLIAPTIFISLFVPIWVQFLTILFKETSISERAFPLAVSITLLLIVIMISITISKWIIKEMFEFVWISESQLKKNLVHRLEELLIEIEEDEKQSDLG
ncbi:MULTISPECIES: hypothetical protein [unclassified Paenibacillus]|uniref:hypothetical protein n=1 Tax=unclassified Paenibacillus TaxID=185978 RepID=UPI000931C1E7|nr:MULTISPECIES: hypothetical protein [unclassified Paenibacillus]